MQKIFDNNLGGLLKSIHIVLFLFVTSVTFQSFSQRVSRNNHTGQWSDPDTWVPAWAKPVTDSVRTDIEINGFVTASVPVTFSNLNTELKVNDTLVIRGDLYISSRSSLKIANNGMLLILGSLILGNHTTIEAYGYLVIRDNVVKHGSFMHGYAISNDNPPKVFIGGSIPVNLSNILTYTLFDQVNPILTTPYPGSHYAYGNLDDLSMDQIFRFYTSLFETKPEEIFIPNVITPNNDGRNDFFIVRNAENEGRLLILNKWGGVEYSKDQYEGDWDGRNSKGQELPADTYFYILDFGNGLVRRGSVLIIR